MNKNKESLAPQQNETDIQQQGKRFKFMANVLQGPAHQTQDVDWLKKFTPDTQISYNRMLMSMGIAALFTLLAISQLFSRRAAYIALPTFLMLGSILLLIFMFMLPARGRSMLEVSVSMLFTWLSNKLKSQSGRKSNLKTFGIVSFDEETGIAHMEDGDLALIYDVEGALSLSTLPNLADAVSSFTSQYYIARGANSQQESIISIIRIDSDSYIRSLQEVYEAADKGTKRDEWVRYMSRVQQEYIHSQLSNEYVLKQVIIIRDEDAVELKKTMEAFEQSVNMGMLARATRLMTEQEIVKAFSSITTLARKERMKYGKR